MNRLLAPLYPTALAAGALAIGWAAWAAAQHHPLALAMALLIAAFYALGAWELRGLRHASAGLQRALQGLSTPPPNLADWLAQLPSSLREPVRHSLDSGRALLPGPALAPALAGLLVLLGMLGTFIGLVITLGGTANALRATADLAAMRTALGAPVQGLGLAFGSSVAGVAGSAMLGLMAALARRERASVGQALQAALGGALQPFTAAALRREAAQAAQTAAHSQLQALPALLAQVQAHSAGAMNDFSQQLGRQLAAQQAQFQAQWLAEQDRFHAETQGRFQALAAAVESSLTHSLHEGARLAGETIAPAVQATMAAVARQAGDLHQRLGAEASAQLGALHSAVQASTARTEQALLAASQTQTEHLGRSVQSLQQGFEAALTQAREAAAHSQALAQQQLAEASTAAQTHIARSAAHTEQTAGHLLSRFAEQSQALVSEVAQTQRAALAQQAQADDQRLQTWAAALAANAATLQQDAAANAAALQQAWAQATEQAQAQQLQSSQRLADTAHAVVAQAEAQARATIHEVSGLLHTAAEAPRAAAEVVAALREQLSKSLAQDNAALAERAELMQTLHTLLDSVAQAAGQQRSAIDALLSGTAGTLDELGQRFATQAAHSHDTLTHAATQLAGSAAEMASLGEGFGAAVGLFHGASETLVAQLQRLDSALARNTERSDEQLGYYVAQAREVIDLCLMSQKQVLDGLQAVAAPRAGAVHG